MTKDIVFNKAKNVNDQVAIVYALARDHNLGLSPLHDTLFIEGREHDVEAFKARMMKILPEIDFEDV
jgi:hypothetical protein